MSACCRAPWRILTTILLALVFWTHGAGAAEVYSDDDWTVNLGAALKISGLDSYGHDDPVLYPRRATATGLFRGRLTLTVQLGDLVTSEAAYEHSMRWVTAAQGLAGAGVLPGNGDPPYRISPVRDEIAEKDRFVWSHELDRALIAFHPSWGEVTVGRQAIGLGRGVVFAAADLFAPFSPTEADREWRLGVDAARVEARLTQTASAEVIGVFGETWDDSALVARLRGYMGDVDGELLFGRRARDEFAGLVFSANLGGAEAHMEGVLFHTPERQFDGGLFGNPRLAPKLVAGSSYTFALGNGLTVLGEYHYSGFGLKDVADATALLATPAFNERVARGDTQILGRHALAAQVSYPINEAVTGTFTVLQSPQDGSGMALPSLRWDINEHTTFTLTAYAPWGQRSRNGFVQTEYGASAWSLFGQLAFYF